MVFNSCSILDNYFLYFYIFILQKKQFISSSLHYWLFTSDERARLNFIVSFILKLQYNRYILTTHCLICYKPLENELNTPLLQENDSEIQTGLIVNTRNENSVNTCDFKHTLHYKCLEKWKKASHIEECPICLQEISSEIKDNEDLIERILAIQYDLFPNIAKLTNFTFILIGIIVFLLKIMKE